jgi:hypothetical protein
MGKPVICIVTVHGVGFEQPPIDSQPGSGYADDLHQHLSKYLDATLLGDDPQRERKSPGTNGPVYVQSWYPPGSAHATSGLVRLGNWVGAEKRTIDCGNAPLVNGDQRIAHIALVYSNLEGTSPMLGAAAITEAMVAVSASHYIHTAGLLQMAFMDTMALFGQHSSAQAQTQPAVVTPKRATSSLRVRSDAGFKPDTHQQQQNPTGILAILRQLENDVAAYICRNELRERVRCFVLDALLRLAYRDDVEGIVINSHSNGTVIALDVLHLLPPCASAKIKAFITAGSPLRKYIDLFHWGQQIESVNTMQQWHNFWDARDPVADPLAPPQGWHCGDPITADITSGLFEVVNPNTGEVATIPVTDHKVDNLKNSYGGGLQTHNYWDNDSEFVQPLAQLVKQLAVGEQMITNVW